MTGYPRVTAKLKARVKVVYLAAKRLVIRRFYSYDRRALEATLRSLGVAERDTLLVHAAFQPFSGFSGTPQDLLGCFLHLLGHQGNLMMVSMPYTGSAYDYLRERQPFDVGRTMSRMGLLSEVFRRHPSVRRSLNPVHPILALGPQAEWLLSGHDATPFSCGDGTPFEKLSLVGGKILLYDVGYLTATFFHHLEHRFQDRLGVQLYHDELLDAVVIDHQGAIRHLKTHVFDPRTVTSRDQVWLSLREHFRREGALRYAAIGNTPLILIDARRMIECADELLRA